MLSLVSAVEDDTAVASDTTTTSCNLWCKIINFFTGGNQENLVGEAGSGGDGQSRYYYYNSEGYDYILEKKSDGTITRTWLNRDPISAVTMRSVTTYSPNADDYDNVNQLILSNKVNPINEYQSRVIESNPQSAKSLVNIYEAATPSNEASVSVFNTDGTALVRVSENFKDAFIAKGYKTELTEDSKQIIIKDTSEATVLKISNGEYQVALSSNGDVIAVPSGSNLILSKSGYAVLDNSNTNAFLSSNNLQIVQNSENGNLQLTDKNGNVYSDLGTGVGVSLSLSTGAIISNNPGDNVLVIKTKDGKTTQLNFQSGELVAPQKDATESKTPPAADGSEAETTTDTISASDKVAPSSPSEITAAQKKITTTSSAYNSIKDSSTATEDQKKAALDAYNAALDAYDQILAKQAGQEQVTPSTTTPSSTTPAPPSKEQRLADAKKADLAEMRLILQELEQSVNLGPQIERNQQLISETQSTIADCQSDSACNSGGALQIHQIRLKNLEDSQRQLASLKSNSETNRNTLTRITDIIKKDGPLSDEDILSLSLALGKSSAEFKSKYNLDDNELKKYVSELKDALKNNPTPLSASPTVKSQKDPLIAKVEGLANLGQGKGAEGEGLSYFQAADVLDEEADRLEEKLTSLEGLASTYNQVKGNLPQVSFADGVPAGVSGSQLNGIGDFLGVNRNPGENDADYRDRINTPQNKFALSQLDSYAKDKARLEQLREKEDQLRYQHSFIEGSTVGSILKGEWTGDFGKYAGLTRKVIDSRNYQPLSNLLIGEDNYQKWRSNADADWINQIDVSWSVTQEVCKADDQKSSDKPGQNTRFVMTPSGSYQFVGSIQAEISTKQSPIICERNPAEDAEQEFICKGGLTCKDEQFCYASTTDSEPAKGYFYKISWGVSAPQDEKHTVNIDEDGKTIKFNLYLDQDNAENGNEKYLFSRGALRSKDVLALAHGESDGGTITSYLSDKYNRVCIVFDPSYHPIDKSGGDVTRICASFITLDKGVVEYGNSDRSGSSGSTKSYSGEVQQLI